MATGMQTWSRTAATNATADSAVNWAEGQAPSSVNDSARAEMASMAMWRDDNNGTLVTTGSTTAYTVTSNQVEGALTDGYTIALKFHAANDSSATLAVDGLTAKPLQLVAGTNLTGAEFAAGTIHKFTYSSTGTGQWIKQNPALPAGTLSSVVGIQATSTSSSAPAFSFSGDTNTGFRDKGADNPAIMAGGIDIITMTTTGASITGDLTVSGNIGGTAFNPTAPTVQRFTSTSTTTYVLPANVRYIRVKMVGGGGGGGAVTANIGSSGGDTTFGTWTCVAGTGGDRGAAGSTGGTGGSGGTDGTGTKIIRVAGQGGAGGGGTATFAVALGQGGNSFFGGAGKTGNAIATGASAASNSGSGGCGGCNSNNWGSGGGAGEYAEFLVTSPSSVYAIIVGNGGAGGSAGTQAGGIGSTGVVIVEEYYA